MHAIIKECREALIEAIRQEKYEEDAKIAIATVSCNSGYIELYATCGGESYATVWHDSDTEKESLRLEEEIGKNLPNWYDVDVEEDETEIGLDPGFSSWQDYIDYKYN